MQSRNHFIFSWFTLSLTLHSVYFKPSPLFTLKPHLPPTPFCSDSLISNFTGNTEDSRRKHQSPALKTHSSLLYITLQRQTQDLIACCLLVDTAMLITPVIFLISPISSEMESLLKMPTNCLPFIKFFNSLSTPVEPSSLFPNHSSIYFNLALACIPLMKWLTYYCIWRSLSVL